MSKKKGWYGETYRHTMARKGIKTIDIDNMTKKQEIEFQKTLENFNTIGKELIELIKAYNIVVKYRPQHKLDELEVYIYEWAYKYESMRKEILELYDIDQWLAAYDIIKERGFKPFFYKKEINKLKKDSKRYA